MSVSNIPESGNFIQSSDKSQSSTVKIEQLSDQGIALKNSNAIEGSVTASNPNFAFNAEERNVAELTISENTEIISEQLKAVNDILSLQSKSLVFEFDDINDPPIIKVVDSESGDIIREIPPKEIREIAQALTDIADILKGEDGLLSNRRSSGILIDEKL